MITGEVCTFCKVGTSFFKAAWTWSDSSALPESKRMLESKLIWIPSFSCFTVEFPWIPAWASSALTSWVTWLKVCFCCISACKRASAFSAWLIVLTLAWLLTLASPLTLGAPPLPFFGVSPRSITLSMAVSWLVAIVVEPVLERIWLKTLETCCNLCESTLAIEKSTMNKDNSKVIISE